MKPFRSLLMNHGLMAIAGFCIGYLVVAQFYVQIKLQAAIQARTPESIAFEIAQSALASVKLQDRLSQLVVERDELSRSLQNAQQTREAVDKEIEHSQILLGIVPVKGTGVVVTVTSDVDAAQILDLINGLKSVGAEVISVNDTRVVPTSAVRGDVFSPPITIRVLGDAPLIHQALVRNGGLLNQLDIQADVEMREAIVIESREAQS